MVFQLFFKMQSEILRDLYVALLAVQCEAVVILLNIAVHHVHFFVRMKKKLVNHNGNHNGNCLFVELTSNNFPLFFFFYQGPKFYNSLSTEIVN